MFIQQPIQQHEYNIVYKDITKCKETFKSMYTKVQHITT